MGTGKTKWFNNEKGFGFIKQDDGGPDLFVHITSIENARTLSEGQSVTYEIEQGEKGPSAILVEVIEDDT